MTEADAEGRVEEGGRVLEGRQEEEEDVVEENDGREEEEEEGIGEMV